MYQFVANTKFLLTGEYLILLGADAVVLPLRFTQKMSLSPGPENIISWKSKAKNKLWFWTKIEKNTKIIESSDPEKSSFLIRIFQAMQKLNPDLAMDALDILIEADFDMQWGLGSSSTLISLLAQYAEIDAFELNRMLSEGSGYDVVAATRNSSFIFHRDGAQYFTRDCPLRFPFRENLYFVYTGHKQSTEDSIRRFNALKKKNLKTEINEISEISAALPSVGKLDEFEYLLNKHEQIMTSVLKRKSLKQTIFKDLNGASKSLGAWGGDFAMITWHDSKQALKKYLYGKNIQTYFPWTNIVL
jgi:mevalonate kinase